MSAGFTPAPWRIEPHAKFGDTQMYWVNDFTSVGTGIKPDVVLIRAAPELYETLQNIRDHSNLSNASASMIDAVLAKARGEQ